MKAVELKKILDVVVSKYPNSDVDFLDDDGDEISDFIVSFNQGGKEIFNIDLDKDTFKANISLLKEFLENSGKKIATKGKTSNTRLSNLDD